MLTLASVRCGAVLAWHRFQVPQQKFFWFLSNEWLELLCFWSLHSKEGNTPFGLSFSPNPPKSGG